MAKATKQELETAKAKAVEGGMPQDVADEVIQMAGSKGTFAMQMNKQKNNSADNFSSKDSMMMMQSALYNPGHGGEPNHTHNNDGSNKIPTVTVEKSSSSTNVNGGSSNNSSSSGTGVSYSKAYEKADKNKYPTLESFTKAAKAYNEKQNSNKSNNISNKSSSSSKNIALSDKSESDILGEQKSVTKSNTSIIQGIDDLAKIQRTSDSIAGRNKYINKLNFSDFKKANTPGTSQYNDANKVGSAYATAGESNSGYSSFAESLNKAKDSSGKPMFSSPGDFISTVYKTSDRPMYKQPFANTSDYPIAEKVSKSLGSSWDVNKTMKSLREEQSNLKMAPLKFYGGKNKK